MKNHYAKAIWVPGLKAIWVPGLLAIAIHITACSENLPIGPSDPSHKDGETYASTEAQPAGGQQANTNFTAPETGSSKAAQNQPAADDALVAQRLLLYQNYCDSHYGPSWNR